MFQDLHSARRDSLRYSARSTWCRPDSMSLHSGVFLTIAYVCAAAPANWFQKKKAGRVTNGHWTFQLIFHIIQSGLNDVGMADGDIDSTAQLFTVPGLPFMGGHAGPEHAGANPLGPQQLLQPCGYVVFVGVDGKHLALAPAGKLRLDFPDESSLLGIDLAFIQILRFRDDEALALLSFRVVAGAVERSQAVRVVGIDQQRIEHGAQHAAIAAMLLQGRGNLVLQLLVSC